MIEYLSGIVLTRLPHSIIIDVNGVGYGLEMPLSSLCEVPTPGNKIAVWVETYVREDALKLYGFLNFEDRQVFGMLRSVSGIGPKIALAILSTFDAKTLRKVVLSNHVDSLESVPGIGRRTAEKLMLELKPKMEKLSFVSPRILEQSQRTHKDSSLGTSSTFDEFGSQEEIFDDYESLLGDLRSALENLGYKEKEISPVVSALRSKLGKENLLMDSGNGDKIKEEINFQFILKSALKAMRVQI